MRSAARAGYAAAAALAAVLTLAGCSAIDALYGKTPGPKPAPLPPLTNPAAVKVLWSARVGEAGRFVFSPAVVGDSVYAAGRDGQVVRLDASSGASRWRASVGRLISSGVAANGRTVVVAAEDGEVIALDAETGAARWRARVSSEVNNPAALTGGLVIVRSADNRIFAFSEDDGKRAWVYQRAAASLIMRTPGGLTVLDDLVFAGFPGGRLVALQIANGVSRWEVTISLPKGATELERVSDVVGEPAVQGREVCAAAYQGRVACYDAATGKQTWSREMSSLTGVSLDSRYAYVSDDRGAVHALDRSTGRSFWKQDQLSLRQLTLPLAVGNTVAVGDYQGYVHFLARDSGAFLARDAASSSALRTAPVPLGTGALVVQAQNGSVIALAP